MRKIYNAFKPILVFLLLGSSSLYAQVTTFAYTGSIVNYTVPAGVTTMAIAASGAQGGLGNGAGGKGAIMTGTFNVTPGHVLKVLVGQQTTTTTHFAGGGGGGSFVWDSTGGSLLLVAAGGGGGGGSTGTTIGLDAVVTPNGTDGGAGATYPDGGTGGNGATAPAYAKYAGGGAGWISNGAAGLDAGCSTSAGGKKPLLGGAGGTFGGTATTDGNGGFGGGGGAQGNCSNGYGGGGGGYSGGGAGTSVTLTSGGGGGSYNGGTPQVNSVGNTGNGSVSLTPICMPPTAGTIAGPTSICAGSSTTLTDPTASPAGLYGIWTWSSSNPLVATINAATGSLTGVGMGIDTIKLTVTYTCGVDSTIKIVTVNPLPAPIAGYTDVCPGSSTTLTDATPFGQWASSAPAIDTINATTGALLGVAPGFSTITYTLLTTGCFVQRTEYVISISGGSVVCGGDTLHFSASHSGGTWSSADTTIARVDTGGVVTGIGLGTVYISYTLPSGCSVRRTITVNPLAPIVGITSVCIGQSRYLTDIVGGGVWSSSFPGVATVTFDSGRVFGVMVGISDISYTLPSGCRRIVSFNVVDYPAPITGTFIACPNSSATLTDGTGGGTWTSGNNLIVTVNPTSGVITGVAADTANIFYTVFPGCTVRTTVTINPLPAPITGNSIICPGTKDSLSDATLFGLWSSVTPAITTVDSVGVVTALLASGNGIIRYTLPLTGCYVTATVTVEALPVPVIVYNYLYGTLYATPGYAHYQWYDSSSGLIPGATSSSIAASQTDYYYVIVTDSSTKCKGQSAPFHYDISMVGVNNTISANGTLVYPNPANGVIYVQSPVKVKAVITSVEGKTMLEQANAHEMNISTLANGMYFVSLYDENGLRVHIQKVIKE
jgi:uncharacterized protein YjdB